MDQTWAILNYEALVATRWWPQTPPAAHLRRKGAGDWDRWTGGREGGRARGGRAEGGKGNEMKGCVDWEKGIVGKREREVRGGQ